MEEGVKVRKASIEEVQDSVAGASSEWGTRAVGSGSHRIECVYVRIRRKRAV